jgi:ATP/maltotriose-dependent transcriptional regulator MalT
MAEAASASDASDSISGGDSLLRTKLYIPHVRPDLVTRSRLVERLQAGSERALTLIAAPAGLGKTTLLAEWIPHSARCVTWISLDEGDNDLARFWAYWIAALQMLRGQHGYVWRDYTLSPVRRKTAHGNMSCA